jgi:hypothetical protein
MSYRFDQDRFVAGVLPSKYLASRRLFFNFFFEQVAGSVLRSATIPPVRQISSSVKASIVVSKVLLDSWLEQVATVLEQLRTHFCD